MKSAQGQAYLWDAPKPQPPLARRTDPATSKAAAESIVTSGKAGAHRAIVLAAMKAHPGLTSFELAKFCDGIGEAGAGREHEVGRRCSDLMRDGLARQGEKRPCGVRGTGCVIWWAV